MVDSLFHLIVEYGTFAVKDSGRVNKICRSFWSSEKVRLMRMHELYCGNGVSLLACAFDRDSGYMYMYPALG